MQSIHLIAVDTPEFDQLVTKVSINTIKVVMDGMQQDRWLTREEAMNELRITSLTTLAKYRDEEGSPIIFSKPGKDVLYLKSSLHAYLLWKSNKKNNP